MTELSFDAVTLDMLLELKKGNVIEVPGLMAGLDPDEPVLVTVTEKQKELVAFRLTYHGVWVANAKLFRSKDGPKWL